MLKTGKCLPENGKTRATFLLNTIIYAFGRKFLFYLKKSTCQKEKLRYLCKDFQLPRIWGDKVEAGIAQLVEH